jgi:hypothetical protein
VNDQCVEINQKRRSSERWLMLTALISLLMASLGCSLGGRLERLPLVGDHHGTAAHELALATYTPW